MELNGNRNRSWVVFPRDGGRRFLIPVKATRLLRTFQHRSAIFSTGQQLGGENMHGLS